MARFVLLGAAGFIAPRHLEAIKDLGHQLVAAFDPNDSVGILDRYFPECAFFTRFDKLQSFLNDQDKFDFVSICSPNFLHFDQVRWALGRGANVICEKPLVLSVREADELLLCERKASRRISTVLQLRVHAAIRELKEKIGKENKTDHKVDLTYITSRGPWYQESWKGDLKKSGGLAFNIGIHFFDMLTWIFGKPQEIRLDERTSTYEAGFLQLETAAVHWRLSIDRTRLPAAAVTAGKTTFRSINIDGHEFEFSDGFTELHKTVYRDIINGEGYGVEDARSAIDIAEKIKAL